MPKVSIIVPCYNVEKYIKKGLQSIIDQTLKDIEIIIVNDGSTDSTLKMIKSCRDTRSKLIDKKNEGVSKARNNAIDIATGDYIAFMDSDDWMEPNMLELMYKKAIKGQFDVVACDVNAIYPYKSITIKSNIHENKEIKNILIDAYAVIWNTQYKAEFV